MVHVRLFSKNWQAYQLRKEIQKHGKKKKCIKKGGKWEKGRCSI